MQGTGYLPHYIGGGDLWAEPEARPPRKWPRRMLIGLTLLLLAALSTCVMPPLAPAASFKCTAAQYESGECEPFAAPDVADWFNRLRMPDAEWSRCCGEADHYYADEVDRCGPLDGADCALVAIVTDARPDEITVRMSDGNTTTIHRKHVAPGTRVPVPRVKLRKVPVPNPTEHTSIFLGVDDEGKVSVVHCYEPQGGL